MALRRKARRGAEAIEFALVFPVLMGITAGIIDWSWYYSQHLSLLHEVREGMRSAGSQDSDVFTLGDAEDIIEARFVAQGVTGYTVTASYAPSGAVCLLDFAVTVGPYDPLWGLVPTPAQHNIHEKIRTEDQDICP